MSKFGEWHYDGDKLIRNADGKVIADILSILDWLDPWREISAYGQLIAAAPDMYKILDGLIYKLKANGADEREEIDEAIQEIERLIERIDGKEAQE